MAAIDLCLKPSLSTYTFRPEPFAEAVDEALGKGVDGDEALLDLIEAQIEVAAKKLRSGEPRRSLKTLHRALAIVEEYVSTSSGVVPPSTYLAGASVRLALCVALSSFGQHATALSEARLAQAEIDKAWRSLLDALEMEEAATFRGGLELPAPVLRAVLRNPPPWLEKAVEVAVQARHCIAMELEFKEAEAAAAAAAAMALRRRGGSRPSLTQAAGAADESEEARALPATSEPQIGTLHREGVQLAQQLLAPGHAVRARAERALRQWEERSTATTTGKRSTAAGAHRSRSTPASSMEVAHHPRVQRAAPAAVAAPGDGEAAAAEAPAAASGTPGPPQEGGGVAVPQPRDPTVRVAVATIATAEDGEQPAGTRAVDTAADSAGQSNNLVLPSILQLDRRKRLPLPRRAPLDLQTDSSTMSQLTSPSRSFSHGIPGAPRWRRATSAAGEGSQASFDEASGSNAFLPFSPNASPARSSTEEGPVITSKSMSSPPQDRESHQQRQDLFEDWRRNMVNPNHLSSFFQQLKTDDGLSKLQTKLRVEANRFKNCWLKSKTDEDLYQDRMFFGAHGKATLNRAMKDKYEWKTKDWQVAQEAKRKRLVNRDLYAYYGVDCQRSLPDLQTLNKLLKASHKHGVDLWAGAFRLQMMSARDRSRAGTKQAGGMQEPLPQDMRELFRGTKKKAEDEIRRWP